MGDLNDYFFADHRRLSDLLAALEASPGAYDAKVYEEFRSGMLRHIAMEEKFVMPSAREAKGGTPLLIQKRIRSEHGAMAALLVPPPGKGVCDALRRIMDHHNDLEEGPGGLYQMCEDLAGKEAEDVLRKSREFPAVLLPPNNPDPIAYEAAVRTMDRAGYRATVEELKR